MDFTIPNLTALAIKACIAGACIYGSEGVYRELSTNDAVLSNISSSLNDIKTSVDGLKADVAAIKAGSR